MNEIVATWDLSINGRSVTEAISSDVTDLSYTDKLHGEADEIDVGLMDPEGLWRGPWCPEPGDIAVLRYGTAEHGTVFAGQFELDEPSCKIGRNGDSFKIRGLAAPVTKALRTEKSKTHEDMSVEDIITTEADEAGLAVKGSFNPMTFKLRRRRRETLLSFAVRMAEDTDHYAAIRGQTLQFWKVDDIDGAGPVRTFEVGDPDVHTFSGRLESASTRQRAKATCLHEDLKELIEGEEVDGEVRNADILRIVQRCDDEAQAKLLAKSKLHHGNRQNHEGNRRKRNGTLKVSGNPYLVAGARIDLGSTFGRWAGKYVIDQSSHRLHPGPYETSINIKAARA